MDKFLYLEGTGEFSVPYSGYIEVNVKIPQFSQYNENT